MFVLKSGYDSKGNACLIPESIKPSFIECHMQRFHLHHQIISNDRRSTLRESFLISRGLAVPVSVLKLTFKKRLPEGTPGFLVYSRLMMTSSSSSNSSTRSKLLVFPIRINYKFVFFFIFPRLEVFVASTLSVVKTFKSRKIVNDDYVI